MNLGNTFPPPLMCFHWNELLSESRFGALKNYRVGFWQNGLSADSYFGAIGLFRGFCRRIFLLIVVGKVPRKSSRKIPGKILQILQYKNPRHISAEGPGQKIANRRFKAIRANRSKVMTIWGFPVNRIAQSPRFALRIAGPSKS